MNLPQERTSVSWCFYISSYIPNTRVEFTCELLLFHVAEAHPLTESARENAHGYHDYYDGMRVCCSSGPGVAPVTMSNQRHRGLH